MKRNVNTSIRKVAIFTLLLNFFLAAHTQYSNVNFLLEKAKEFRAQGQADSAIYYCNTAIKLDPGNAYAYIDRGRVYDYMKNYDQAIKDFLIAIDLDSGNVDSYNNMGLLLLEKGSYFSAINYLNKAIELDSNNWESYLYRGLAYHSIGNYGQASNDYLTCLNMQPLNYYALINLFPCLIHLEFFDEAAIYYEMYQENKVKGYLEEKKWRFYKDYLVGATVYLKKGEYESALLTLEDAVCDYESDVKGKEDKSAFIKTSFSDVLALKAYVQEKLGMNIRAEGTYKKALAFNSNQPDVKDAIKRLTFLNGYNKNRY